MRSGSLPLRACAGARRLHHHRQHRRSRRPPPKARPSSSNRSTGRRRPVFTQAGAAPRSGGGGAQAGGGVARRPGALSGPGYLAAHTEGGMTSLAWAFDVYDAERKRALPAARRGTRRAAASWAAANDAMLQRIATTSMDRAHDLHRLRPHAGRDRRGGRPSGRPLGARPADRAPTPAAHRRCARPTAAEPARYLAYSVSTE